MSMFEETALEKPRSNPGFLTKSNRMILKTFQFIETVIVTTIEGLWMLSSHSLVKTVSKEAIGVFFEMFVYLILGVCCILIAAILQTDRILNENKAKLVRNEEMKEDEEEKFALAPNFFSN